MSKIQSLRELPEVVQKMELYLQNQFTCSIFFKPIKSNIFGSTWASACLGGVWVYTWSSCTDQDHKPFWASSLPQWPLLRTSQLFSLQNKSSIGGLLVHQKGGWSWRVALLGKLSYPHFSSNFLLWKLGAFRSCGSACKFYYVYRNLCPASIQALPDGNSIRNRLFIQTL